MNDSTVKSFLVLAHERNFTKAAQRLHVTQQTLSASIASLERELNTKLFVRHTPLILTYGGEVFLRYAQTLADVYQQIDREFDDISNNHVGKLRIGLSYSHSAAMMPQLIARFRQTHPYIRFSIDEDTHNHAANLAAGSLDLVVDFLRGKEMDPAFQYDLYLKEKIVLLCSRSLLENAGIDPQTAGVQLAEGNMRPMEDCPFILGHAGSLSTDAGAELLSNSGIVPDVPINAHNINTIFSLCVQGFGACFAPLNLVHTFLSPQQLEQLHIFSLPQRYEYPIYFISRKQQHRWKVVDEFIDMAKNNLPVKYQDF